MYKTIGLKHETPVYIGAQRCKDNKLKCIPGKMFDWDKAVDIINDEECWKERDDSDFQTLIHDVWTEDLIRRLNK